MSASLRDRRALVYSYRDAGTPAEPASQYVRQSSGDTDHSWWCTPVQTAGQESTVGDKAAHRLQATVGFAAEAPVTENGAVVVGGVEYLVRAITKRDYDVDELQVEVERSVAALDLVNT